VIHDNGDLLGFIVADFEIDDFSGDEKHFKANQSWCQIKGDPAIRQNLFQQKHVISAMDQHLDQVHDIITNLICKLQSYTMGVHEPPYGHMNALMNISCMYWMKSSILMFVLLIQLMCILRKPRFLKIR